ncbi:MAG: hypothetical protein ACKVS9_06280 [Phycisphaerae bacterium]
MNRFTQTLTILAIALVSTLSARAGLPLPDGVVLGELRINGQLIPATRTDVSVIARRLANGNPTDIVGQYAMGSRGTLGDKFAVNIRMESLANGQAAAANAIRVGDTVRLFVREGTGSEQATGVNLTITQVGPVITQNLNVGAVPCPTDVNSDGRTDLVDLAFLLTNFGLSGNVSREQGDIDDDDDVDLIDLANLLVVFGLPCPP